MDDHLKLKIAASLDLPADAAADPDVARALHEDPAAGDYARSLHTLDRALRTWPVRTRSDADDEAFLRRLDAKLDEAVRERAKARKGKKVSAPAEPDYAAAPVFEDDPSPNRESKQPMSEPQEHDADHENLAALTRVSTVPARVSAVPSMRPSLASISDAVDDTSSGIVDIKKLAEMAREEAAKPVAKVEEKPAAKADEKPVAKAEEKPAAKAKTDDVMVTPKKAAPLPDVDAPRRGGGGNTLYGALGGMALMAGVFAIYNNMRGDATSASPPAVTSEAAPQTAAAPAQPAAPTVNDQAPVEGAADRGATGSATTVAPTQPEAPVAQLSLIHI